MTMKSDVTPERLEALVDEILAEPLPRPWDPERSLTDAGLDSVGVIHLVAALEERFGITLGDEDLDARHLDSIAGLMALVTARVGSAS